VFLESAAAHYEVLNTTEDFDAVSLGNVRAEMAAAKADLDEALRILDTVSYDRLSPDGKKQLNALKTLCEVDGEFAAMMCDEGCDLLKNSQDMMFERGMSQRLHHWTRSGIALSG